MRADPPLSIELNSQLNYHRFEDSGLVLEVGVDRAVGNSGGLGNIADSCRRVALLLEYFARFDQQVLPRASAAFSQRIAPCCPPLPWSSMRRLPWLDHVLGQRECDVRNEIAWQSNQAGTELLTEALCLWVKSICLSDPAAQQPVNHHVDRAQIR